MTRIRRPLGSGPGSTFAAGSATEATGSAELFGAEIGPVVGVASAVGVADALGPVGEEPTGSLGDSAGGSDEQARRRAQLESRGSSFIDTPAPQPSDRGAERPRSSAERLRSGRRRPTPPE
jgi:hypothetical protein